MVDGFTLPLDLGLALGHELVGLLLGPLGGVSGLFLSDPKDLLSPSTEAGVVDLVGSGVGVRHGVAQLMVLRDQRLTLTSQRFDVRLGLLGEVIDG